MIVTDPNAPALGKSPGSTNDAVDRSPAATREPAGPGAVPTLSRLAPDHPLADADQAAALARDIRTELEGTVLPSLAGHRSDLDTHMLGTLLAKLSA